jgi:hypothetical protein
MNLSDRSEEYRAGVLSAVLERLVLLEAKLDKLLEDTEEDEES